MSEQLREFRRSLHPGLLSGMALAGANRARGTVPPENDGFLTALDVAELDLRRADPVVLSACETGLGKTAGGEGTLGLQRAFQVAGARRVVSSLWQVDDSATQELMERLYENLLAGKLPRLEALREAQLWMLAARTPQEAATRGLLRENSAPVPQDADGRMSP